MTNQISFLKTHIPPLAELMRPKTLDEVVGQEHLINPGKFFRRAVEKDCFSSCIFWGPPGTGKTTLANVIAKTTKRDFVSFHAAFNGIKDIKELIVQAKNRINAGYKNTILFIDEIHRFNKAQQDAFLKPVEQGTILLIGATTENPSFEINSALLSRCNVYMLKQINKDNISKLIKRALNTTRYGLKTQYVKILDNALELLVNYANGDARTALNILEISAKVTNYNNDGKKILTTEIIKEVMSNRRIFYDKKGEESANITSALQKSIRGSNVQASLYWLYRMIEGGEDPLYIARRLIRIASEDIGLADPQALIQAVAAKDAMHFLGYPEGNTALAQATIYLATAPKSNSVYLASTKVRDDIYEKQNEPVPMHIRNAPTQLMKNLGYGKNYKYEHDSKYKFSGQDFLPESLKDSKYYIPGNFGFEKEIQKRIEFWDKLKKEIQK